MKPLHFYRSDADEFKLPNPVDPRSRPKQREIDSESDVYMSAAEEPAEETGAPEQSDEDAKISKEIVMFLKKKLNQRPDLKTSWPYLLLDDEDTPNVAVRSTQ